MSIVFSKPVLIAFAAGLATGCFLAFKFVAIDYATSMVPGWHATIFPPYYIPGAVLSALAFGQLVLALIHGFSKKSRRFLTLDRLEFVNWLLLIAAIWVGVSYLSELATAWYSGYLAEQFAFYNRSFGIHAWAYFGMMFFNVGIPHLLWFEKIRRSWVWTAAICFCINIGLWFEKGAMLASHLNAMPFPGGY